MRAEGSGTGPAGEARELAGRLRVFLASEIGVPEAALRVSELRRLAGGASRELWSLDLEIAQEGRTRRLELVLRRDPPGRVGESDRSHEFALLRAAASAGVPVPRVYWCSTDPAILGSPFFLMDRVAGETLPRRLLRDAEYATTRSRLTGELGAILSHIHAIDLDRPELAEWVASTGGASTARAEVERIAEGVRQLAVEPHPVLDLAERWLLERAPEPSGRALVHGDYRVGNLIFDTEGIRAVLDWELAHVGDPIEDLGWLCVRAWRFGNDALAVGGVGSREELIEAYQDAGGRPVDPAALRFWEACGNFKLALVFISQARVFLDGLPSVELASLGRRTAEAEQELLELMDAEGSRT